MPTLKGSHEGDITVSDSLEILGQVKGNITVIAGGVLELKGTINGNCRVEPNGVARIYGSIRGTLENNRGSVEVWGVVEILRDCDVGVRSIVNPKASIKNFEVGACG